MATHTPAPFLALRSAAHRPPPSPQSTTSVFHPPSRHRRHYSSLPTLLEFYAFPPHKRCPSPAPPPPRLLPRSPSFLPSPPPLEPSPVVSEHRPPSAFRCRPALPLAARRTAPLRPPFARSHFACRSRCVYTLLFVRSAAHLKHYLCRPPLKPPSSRTTVLGDTRARLPSRCATARQRRNKACLRCNRR